MADIWDVLSTLTGGQTPATVLGPAAALGPVAPLAGPALAPAMQGLAQWANVPGPPQNVGDVFNRLGQVLHAATTLGGGAGIIATQPYFQRQAQIANDPRLANIPLPWIAGMAGTSLALPSLLPGGQQIAEGLGLPPPPQGYGDVIGPAYAAAAQQEGGLAGLGAALDALAERWHATPEVVPLTKFAAENITNPLNAPGTIAKLPGIAGAAGRAGLEAMNFPFTAVKGGLEHVPWFSDLSDRAKATLYSQAFSDLQRNITAGIGELGLPVPESLGRGAAADPRGLGMQAARGAMRADAELQEQAAKQATANAAAAQAHIADRFAGGGAPAGAPESPIFQVGGQIGGPPAAAPAADAAGAAVAAGGPLHDLNWLNNRAQGGYRFATEATNAAPGVPPHLPGNDIPLDIVRSALDPDGHADEWLGAVLTNIRTEGVRSGQVVEETAKAQRRRGHQRGGGPGLTSERTGPLLFEPDTVHQVSDVVLRLQERTKRGQAGGLPLGEDVRLATGVRWMEQHQYGDTFPVPPPGEKGYYWAAIQRHMEQLGELPRGPEPTVPPVGGVPGPAPPAAGGAVPDLTMPEAAPAPGVPPLAPEGPPPVAAPGATPPPAGGALPLEGVPPTVAPPAGAPSVPGALSSAADAELLAQQEALEQEVRRLLAQGGRAPAVPDVVIDPLLAKIEAIRTLRQGPPRVTGETVIPTDPYAPPSIMPEGPLGGMAGGPLPTEAIPAGTTMASDAEQLRLAVEQARKYKQIVDAESQDLAERAGATAELKAAEDAYTAALTGAFPSQAQVVAGELAPHIASARASIQRFTTPEQAADVATYGERLGTTLDKFFPAVDRARQLRAEAGLAEGACLKDTIKTLKQQGSDLTGEAQQLQKDWRSDLLAGDWENIVHQNVLKAEMKARGLDPDKFAGPEWLRSMTDAWRAQALVSGAFHVKNVADSVIKSYIDSNSPGFLAGARPWNKDDLAQLIKTAWHESSPAANPNAGLSPQVRVWSAIHELPVYDTMFASQNPTLTQALKALPQASRENVLKQLSPVERELMRLDPTLAVPSSIKEAIGPLETGGFLGKIPFVDRVLAMNLRLTMGIEQSARGAKFITSYDDFVKAGVPEGQAYQQAIGEANRLFFDYQGGLTNADVMFRHVFGFHTFASRNLNYYAPILASNPILIKALKGWEDFSNEQAEEGGYAANRRFAESLKIPMVGGIGGGIAQTLFGRQGQLFWNPAVYFSIGEQMLSTPQEYRDEPLLGKVLSKARTYGAGLAPWIDIPLQMAGAYGARGPQSLGSLDTLLESAFQTATGRPGELPWKTVQRIRPPGQATPAALDIGVRQRLGEMSLEERPDFARLSPGQPIHPDFVRAMAEGPGNPLYEEAARDVGKERLMGVALGKVTGGAPGFQSETAGRMAQAMGNMPRDLTRGGREQYLAGRAQALAPEDLPLLTARREIGIKGLNEPGSRVSGMPEESPQAYVARVWPSTSPARQWALLQTQDPALREAITTYLGSRVRLHSR